MMGKWWLVTWNTYGSWLPGDPRGFKTWRKRRYIPPPAGESELDEPNYQSDRYLEEHEYAKQITGEPFSIPTDGCRQVLDAIVQDIESLSVYPAILAVAPCHVHLIAKFGGLKIRPTVGRLRSAATQRLHENGVENQRIWAKGCHMKSLPDEEAFLQAFAYVREHEMQKAVLKIWQLEFADDVLPF